MTENFADNITVKNAHGGNRECSMANAVPSELLSR